MTVKTPPELPADLAAGLRRLKLATIRELAPELLLTAKTQRWSPEEVLRTLIEAKVAARDASNQRARLKAAGFPVPPGGVAAKGNPPLVGPNPHPLLASGPAAAPPGHQGKTVTAPALMKT